MAGCCCLKDEGLRAMGNGGAAHAWDVAARCWYGHPSSGLGRAALCAIHPCGKQGLWTEGSPADDAVPCRGVV